MIWLVLPLFVLAGTVVGLGLGVLLADTVAEAVPFLTLAAATLVGAVAGLWAWGVWAI